MLTEDDDLIRQHDTPERMQLANSSLSQSSTLAFQDTLTENDLDDAVEDRKDEVDLREPGEGDPIPLRRVIV